MRLAECVAEDVGTGRERCARGMRSGIESRHCLCESAYQFVREVVEHRQSRGQIVAVARDLDHGLHPLLPASQRQTHGLA